MVTRIFSPAIFGCVTSVRISNLISSVVNRTMSSSGRGALIVLEGVDRCGKSTQCKKLVEALQNRGKKAMQITFPDRTTVIGKMISSYLENKAEMDDRVIHLLFSANRWELVPEMKKLLESGTTLVVDRYAYSGVAFTAAKKGMDLEWCRQPDVGLPRPDVVFYLQMSPEDAASRGGYGNERYESQKFQNIVTAIYQKLFESNWVKIDAGRSIDAVHSDIFNSAIAVVDSVKNDKIKGLWTNEII